MKGGAEEQTSGQNPEFIIYKGSLQIRNVFIMKAEGTIQHLDWTNIIIIIFFIL